MLPVTFFAAPSPLSGLARTLDLWATFDQCAWDGFSTLDAHALYRDWKTIGADLVEASLRLRPTMFLDDRWPQLGARGRIPALPVRLPPPTVR